MFLTVRPHKLHDVVLPGQHVFDAVDLYHLVGLGGSAVINLFELYYSGRCFDNVEPSSLQLHYFTVRARQYRVRVHAVADDVTFRNIVIVIVVLLSADLEGVLRYVLARGTGKQHTPLKDVQVILVNIQVAVQIVDV